MTMRMMNMRQGRKKYDLDFQYYRNDIFMTDLTRSMRVSAVVMFLLLDKSDSLARCSWPPPGLIIKVRMMMLLMMMNLIFMKTYNNGDKL